VEDRARLVNPMFQGVYGLCSLGEIEIQHHAAPAKPAFDAGKQATAGATVEQIYSAV